MNLRMSLLTGAMALALSMPAVAQTTELAPGMTASVTAGVNLRAGPGSEHNRIAVIPEGTAVVVEDCVPGWCQVAYDGLSGYVFDTYLAADIAAADAWMLQTTSQHELRAGPGFEHGLVGMIPEGAAVTVEQCMPGWCEVTYDGMTGYLELAEATPEETTLALASPAVGEGMARTTADLNLRAGPGTEHGAIAVIPEGAAVEMEQCQPGWCQVTYGGMTGYAAEAYLDANLGTTAAALAPPATDAGIAQATSDLNLRAGAGMEHSPIGVIPAGAAVEIHDCIPGRVWCEVSYGGMTGYASERYLD
jgi:uncharacterized protein YraI